jgi:hypothetical protein
VLFYKRKGIRHIENIINLVFRFAQRITLVGSSNQYNNSKRNNEALNVQFPEILFNIVKISHKYLDCALP